MSRLGHWVDQRMDLTGVRRSLLDRAVPDNLTWWHTLGSATLAVFMVQVRNVFRAIAAEHTEPGDVLVRANNVTARLNEPDGPFVTCCYAVLDIAARTLRWAQAGHFSPLIVANGGLSGCAKWMSLLWPQAYHSPRTQL